MRRSRQQVSQLFHQVPGFSLDSDGSIKFLNNINNICLWSFGRFAVPLNVFWKFNEALQVKDQGGFSDFCLRCNWTMRSWGYYLRSCEEILPFFRSFWCPMVSGGEGSLRIPGKVPEVNCVNYLFQCRSRSSLQCQQQQQQWWGVRYTHTHTNTHTHLQRWFVMHLLSNREEKKKKKVKKEKKDKKEWAKQILFQF